MATFEAQVEALTSIAIDSSSTPTQDELSQFLKDGVMDVTSKYQLVFNQMLLIPIVYIIHLNIIQPI